VLLLLLVLVLVLLAMVRLEGERAARSEQQSRLRGSMDGARVVARAPCCTAAVVAR